MPWQDTTITALYASNTVFVAQGAEWKYHDQGADLGMAWRDKDYEDSSWASGPAQLGYGDNDVVTTVSYGGSSSDKHPTTYFRHRFVVDGDPGSGDLLMELLRDDGVVLYLNGEELLRDNMPGGTISYTTLASSTVGGGAENTFYPFTLSSSALVSGTNVVAAEVHQRAVNSSDLMFDARLAGSSSVDPTGLDGDADGLPDGWEIDQFGSTEAGLPEVDSDGDGVWNVDEFVAGTQATNGASYFRVEAVDTGGISWTPVSGRVYSVEWSGDLEQSFVEITNGLSGGSYTDPRNPTSAVNCYRIQVELE
jgi:hypothetical protein